MHGRHGHEVNAKRKSNAGRPSRIDDDVRETILDAVADGLSVRRAAIIAGVSHTSVGRECDRNAQFRSDLKKAEAKFERVHLKRIASGAPQWQSSAWLLERKFTDRWGKREPKPQNNVNASAMFTPHASMDSASPAPGTIPAVPRQETIQDREGGATVGKDGSIEAVPSTAGLGALPAQPEPPSSGMG